MLVNCPNLVRDSLYVRFAALCLIMFAAAFLDLQFIRGGGGGGGSSLDYVILLSEGGGWVLITVDYGGGGGGKKCQKIDYVICERPLTNAIKGGGGFTLIIL